MMDFNIFNIQFAAKNAVMGYVNIILPAAFGIGGVLIGFFLNGLRERRKGKQEMQNIRLMMCAEVERIRRSAEACVGMSLPPNAMPVFLNFVAHTPIYDAYVGKLSVLRSEEVKQVDSLYYRLVVLDEKRSDLKKQIDAGDSISAREAVSGIEVTLNDLSEDCVEVEKLLKRHIKTGRKAS